MLRTIDEILKDYPNFKQQWHSSKNKLLKNPNFGELKHVVICDKKGKPLYDQYVIKEEKSAIIIPYEINKGIIKVGMITQTRKINGKTFTEIPRGVCEKNETELNAGIRELFEETGLKIKKEPLLLGRNNFNSSYYESDAQIIVIEFEKIKKNSKIKGDNFEDIKKFKTYTFSEIRELQKKGVLECGITKAALFEFGCFMPEFYNY